jgi:hypothetical protein
MVPSLKKPVVCVDQQPHIWVFILESKVLKRIRIRTGRVAQVVECLPSKHEDLSPNSTMNKNMDEPKRGYVK